MPERTDQLLNAEQVLNDLVKELVELKDQVGGYQDAKYSLSKAGDGLADASNRIQLLCDRLESVSESLRTIGTPELLDGQSKLADSIRENTQALDDKVGELSEVVQQSTKRISFKQLINTLLLLLIVIGVGVLVAQSFNLLSL